jgi:hypothetical protein
MPVLREGRDQMTEDGWWRLLGFGIILIIISAFGMVELHEFAISGGVFLIGIVIAGIGYSKLMHNEKWAINTKQVNENLQNFNDVLWGKEKKPPKEPEPQIKIVIVQKKER